MPVRESTAQDLASILNVHREAFGESEGEVIAQLVVQLLNDTSAQPLLSLVVEKRNQVVAHAIFSSVKLDREKTSRGYILSPLAVAKNAQGAGVGALIIHQGLAMLKARGAHFALVLGDPNYYSRAGFITGHQIKAPFTLEYPEAWMAHALVEDTLEDISATVRCAAALNSPELW